MARFKEVTKGSGQACYLLRLKCTQSDQFCSNVQNALTHVCSIQPPVPEDVITMADGSTYTVESVSLDLDGATSLEQI